MIEINLLPDVYKAEKKAEIEKIPVSLILLSINGILLAVFLIVSAVNLGRAITLNALNTRLHGLAPEQQKIVDIQSKTERLKSVNASFSFLLSPQAMWAEKLNLLSDLMLPGIWFRRLSLEKDQADSQDPTAVGIVPKYLKIEGSVVSPSGDEMSIISDFVRALKANEKFIRDFSNIKLEGVLRRQIATVEVMDFNLICFLKQKAEL